VIAHPLPQYPQKLGNNSKMTTAGRVGGSATLRRVARTRPSASGEAVIESNFEVLVGFEFFTASHGRGSVECSLPSRDRQGADALQIVMTSCLEASYRIAQTQAIRVDKSYVTQRLGRLFSNAESLLEQAISLGPASDVTVLELPAGGYYLIAGNCADNDLAALQAEHGARSGWQVRNSPSSILVSGRSGDQTCLLKRDRPGNALIGTLRDAPAYLLI
jgi:hypothetical protein